MMRICNKCFENKWKYKFVEGIIIATCQICDNEIQFEARKKKSIKPEHLRPVAEYQIRNGKRFLKINGKFTEVYLNQDNKSWRVTPITNY